MVGYYLLLKHFVKIVVFVDPLDLCDHFFSRNQGTGRDQSSLS